MAAGARTNLRVSASSILRTRWAQRLHIAPSKSDSRPGNAICLTLSHRSDALRSPIVLEALPECQGSLNSLMLFWTCSHQSLNTCPARCTCLEPRRASKLQGITGNGVTAGSGGGIYGGKLAAFRGRSGPLPGCSAEFGSHATPPSSGN